MTVPVALQLYSLREAMAEDFNGVVKKVADMGYIGVETAGFPGTTPREARSLFDDLGLQITSAHGQLPVGDKKNEMLDLAEELGCNRLVCAALRSEYYETADKIKSTCDLINQAGANAAERGVSLGMHNHWWEFEKVDGQVPFMVLKECLDSSIFFQIDAYWAKAAGFDPISVIKEMGDRAPLIHIKDGPAVRGEPMVALGEGSLDIAGIVNAAEGAMDWLIVELDVVATDMLTAVEKSYRYLIDQGLAHGNR